MNSTMMHPNEMEYGVLYAEINEYIYIYIYIYAIIFIYVYIYIIYLEPIYYNIYKLIYICIFVSLSHVYTQHPSKAP